MTTAPHKIDKPEIRKLTQMEEDLAYARDLSEKQLAEYGKKRELDEFSKNLARFQKNVEKIGPELAKARREAEFRYKPHRTEKFLKDTKNMDEYELRAYIASRTPPVRFTHRMPDLTAPNLVHIPEDDLFYAKTYSGPYDPNKPQKIKELLEQKIPDFTKQSKDVYYHSTPPPKKLFTDFNKYKNRLEEKNIVRDIVNDIKKDIKHLPPHKQYDEIHSKYLRNHTKMDINTLKLFHMDSVLPDHIHNKIDNGLIKYMISKGMASSRDKTLEEGDVLLDPEYPGREVLLRTRGINIPRYLDKPLVGDKYYENLRNIANSFNSGFKKHETKSAVELFKIIDSKKTDPKKGNLDPNDIFLHRLMSEGKGKNLYKKLFNMLGDFYSNRNMKNADMIQFKERKSIGGVGYTEKIIDILNHYLLREGNYYSSQTNTAIPISMIPDGQIKREALIKQVNKINKHRIHKTHPLFISGKGKDIKINFNIGNSVQIAQMKSGIIEIHILTKFFKEGDLRILSHYLYKTEGTLYNNNKKKLGDLTDNYEVDRLIRANLDIEKPVNVFFIEPKKLMAGSLSRFHSNIGVHNYLRMKLL